MKALTVTSQGDPVTPNVVWSDMPDPVAGDGEVLVRTEASALNHLDLWIGRGLPGIDTVYPHIGGSDGCGRVEDVGEGVDEAWLGRRVLLNAAVELAEPDLPDTVPAGRDIRMIGEHSHGTHAEMFTAPVSNVLDIGQADPFRAAAYGLTHLTAWRMLRSRAGIREGDTLLVTGIGGGAASACLSIGLHLGCTVIVTSRHQWKLDRAVERGAAHGVLDEGEDWSRTIRGLTGGRGVDVVADSIGRAVHKACIKSLARGGCIVTCGCTTGPNPETDLARLFWNQQSIIGSTMGDMDEFRQSTSLFTSGQIDPVIDTVAPAADGVEVFARLESGEQFGKLVLDWT